MAEDGAVVLGHEHGLGAGGRRPRSTAARARADRGPEVLTLDALYDGCGADFELALVVAEPASGPAAAAVARAAGAGGRLWLCHGDGGQLARWRDDLAEVRLVESTRLGRLRPGPERRAAQLAEEAVDGVELHVSEWTGGLTTLFHRFGRLALARGAVQERELAEMDRVGVDGVAGDEVERMVAVFGPRQPG